MDWTHLEIRIKKECKTQNKDEEYTFKYLAYCKKLYDANLPIISSPNHLALLIGIDYEYLCSMAYSQKNFYKNYSIEKKNGKQRKISEPTTDLKFVQNWILHNILEYIPVSKYAKAFKKWCTLKGNAKFHKAQKTVLELDIKDFFPSINIYMIAKIFENAGYLHNVSFFLANLCCYKKVLPQGAPTSPYLSNLVMISFDNSMKEYSLSNGIRYTRYADDITISGNFNPHKTISDVKGLLYKEGFRINNSKTRVLRSNTRQEVTGIVVNSHMQVSKEKRKKIRQELYYIKKYGLDSHIEHINETRQNYLRNLLGRINFAVFVNPNDTEMQEYFEYIKALLIKANE